jgi:hypothetical protein
VSSVFNPRSGLVLVRAELFGPTGSIVLQLALDTGATSTMISVGPLTTVGYDPSLVPGRVQVTTGSGVEFVPRLPISQLNALGQQRFAFPVLSHTLPPSSGIDGLLGLDFLRGQRLEINFVQGLISLA